LNYFSPPFFFLLSLPSFPPTDSTVKKILDPLAKDEMRADSILKKRRRKMNKHKLKRVRKQQRFLMRKLGK
jgi:hypothetical protein